MFVDEAEVCVTAGKGGDGCLSFRREKNVPRGGPDGGDGGRGGNVYLVGDQHLNTLVDFKFQNIYRADHGKPGGGRNLTGKDGDDLDILIPLGTIIYDAETLELIDQVTRSGQRLLVAKGGANGIGNTRFKSSINRSPRRTVPGTKGETRHLRLELQLLADVGLVGLPNAGKSSLLRRVTNAHPKIADYPFTTLKPSLGVVVVDSGRSYTMADIPGLIQGASTGSGLGIQFLKHLRHTRLLYHVVDLFTCAEPQAVAESITVIEDELMQFDKELARRERWLVLNKIDLIPEKELHKRVEQILNCSHWTGPWFSVSAVTGSGCNQLLGPTMTWLEEHSLQRVSSDEHEEMIL